jgi:hypothetical protein
MGQKEVHTAQLLVPDPSYLETEMAIAKFTKYKSPGSDQILAELIQAGGETLLSVMYKPSNSIWDTEELPEWKESTTSIQISVTGAVI